VFRYIVEKCAVALAMLVIAGGCVPGPYQVPPAPPLASNIPSSAGDLDPGDVASVKRLEGECRVRLSGQTAEASLVALDRVHEVLGSSCDVETVARDPLHWLLRCRSDALFDSGKYELHDSAMQNCRELNNQRVNPWVCAGAVLQQLFEQQRGGAIEQLGLAVVGHVDMQPINPQSNSHMCTELQKSFDYHPSPEFTPLPATATDDDRQRANAQLAWCRAASVGQKIRQGMDGARHGADATGVELAALGMGTSWLRSQPGGICPNSGVSWVTRKECADARRVDLLVKFTPRIETELSACDQQSDDPAVALYCMQQCTEQAAAGSSTGTGVATESAPLFVSGPQRAERVPASWYLKRVPSLPSRYLDIDRISKTLGLGVELP
jgi:hypothetical protein